MHNYEKMAKIIRRREGLCFQPYRCPAGKLTIGYGHNLDARGISLEAAELLLRQDIQIAYKQVKNTFPWWAKLTDARFFVLVDLVYNMGLSDVCGFKKMLAALEDGNYETAASELLDSRYARQLGQRAHENAEMLKSGEWIGE